MNGVCLLYLLASGPLLSSTQTFNLPCASSSLKMKSIGNLFGIQLESIGIECNNTSNRQGWKDDHLQYQTIRSFPDGSILRLYIFVSWDLKNKLKTVSTGSLSNLNSRLFFKNFEVLRIHQSFQNSEREREIKNWDK